MGNGPSSRRGTGEKRRYRDGNLRNSLTNGRFPMAHDTIVGVTAETGPCGDLDPVFNEVQNPEFGDAAGGVVESLFPKVELAGGVGHLDNQGDVTRAGVLLRPVQGANDGDVRLGKVIGPKADGVLCRHHPPFAALAAQKAYQHVDQVGVPGSDRAHGVNFPVEQFESFTGRENSSLVHADKFGGGDPAADDHGIGSDSGRRGPVKAFSSPRPGM